MTGGPLDRRLLARAREARGLLAIDIVAGVVSTALLLTQMTLLASVSASAAAGEITDVAPQTVLILLVVVLLRSWSSALVERAGKRAATRVMSSLRRDVVARRLLHGGRHLDDVDSTELATAAVQGIDGLEMYFGRYLPQVVLAAVVPVAVIAWSALIDIQSALIMAVTLPLLPVFMSLIGRAAATRSRDRWESLLLLSSHFIDIIRGLPTLRAFNRGRAQAAKIAETTEQYRRTTMGTLRLAFLSGLVLDLATTMSIALVAVALGVRLVSGSVGLQPALTVLLLVPELYAPIRAVSALHHASADGVAATAMILSLVDAEPPTSESGRDGSPLATRAESYHGAPATQRAALERLGDPREEPVRLVDVSKLFDGRSDAALAGVTMTIEPGEVLALVGPSGSGKTTLARILLGVTEPDGGTVMVGDRIISEDDLDSWRHLVSWAAQRPAIMHASIAENISLAGTHPTDVGSTGTAEEAARAAGAHDFIAELPEGYETLIGSGGRGLSAGERQRIGLARALYRQAPLLVLDEPTSHLGLDHRRRVAEAVETSRGKRSVLILTHDPELAAVADRVLRIDRGVVVADRLSVSGAMAGAPKGSQP